MQEMAAYALKGAFENKRLENQRVVRMKFLNRFMINIQNTPQT